MKQHWVKVRYSARKLFYTQVKKSGRFNKGWRWRENRLNGGIVVIIILEDFLDRFGDLRLVIKRDGGEQVVCNLSSVLNLTIKEIRR
jgi:hypothetical protein